MDVTSDFSGRTNSFKMSRDDLFYFWSRSGGHPLTSPTSGRVKLQMLNR
jgi:hypothetical protein